MVAGGVHKEIKGKLLCFLLTWSYKVHLPRCRYVFSDWVRWFCSSSCIKTKFVRRHMGVTAIDEERGDVDKLLKSIREALGEIMSSKQ